MNIGVIFFKMRDETNLPTASTLIEYNESEYIERKRGERLKDIRIFHNISFSTIQVQNDLIVYSGSK